MNDREKAKKLREKGWNGPSASDKARAKSSGSNRDGVTASGGIVGALRNFDYRPGGTNQKIQPVESSQEAKDRARSHKRGLPGLR